MRSNNYKSVLKHAGLAASVLLLASGAAFAQQQINLTAGPTSLTLPDGSVVPMWGYTCDATQVTGSTATCAKLRSEEHTSELQSRGHLVCRLLLEKKKRQ